MKRGHSIEKNYPTGNLLYHTKPYRSLFLITLILPVIIIFSSIQSYLVERSGFLTFQGFVLCNLWTLGLTYACYLICYKLIFYEIYEYCLFVPKKSIKPRHKSRYLFFRNIAQITCMKGYYTLIDTEGTRYLISSLNREEIIPKLQAILGEKWNELLSNE